MATKTGKTPPVINPITGKPLRREAAEYVHKVRAVRRQARSDARSGNPAKAKPAAKAAESAPRLIWNVFIQEVTR